MDKKSIISIGGLIIAIITLFFGDNLYEQVKGRSVFSNEPASTIATSLPSDFSVPKQLTNTPEVAKVSSDFLQTINATKVEIKFFESNDEYLPPEQRVYTNKFDSKTVRNINVDLMIEYYTYWGKNNFTLDNEIYKSTGRVYVGRSMDNSPTSFPSFTDSLNKIWRFPSGLFGVDTYTVVIYADNAEIGRASFTVE